VAIYVLFYTNYTKQMATENFKYQVEEFADIKILRYKVSGFDKLSTKEQELLYYLHNAGLCGRDIIWNQNFKYGLFIRKVFEYILTHPTDTDTHFINWSKLVEYLKRMWVSNGVHHHYSDEKFLPEFDRKWFEELLVNLNRIDQQIWNTSNYTETNMPDITEIIFNPNLYKTKTNKNDGVDKIKESCVNFYEGVTEEEVNEFYKNKSDPNDKQPPSHGLNSKLIKNSNNEIVELTWKVGGMYGQALEKMVYWLNKAIEVADTPEKAAALTALVKYFTTGDLHDFNEYNIKWLQDKDTNIDMICGFIEVYADPLAYKGSYETIITVVDQEASERTKILIANAQWFEENSPVMPNHKKKEAKGILAKVVNAVSLAGDNSPTSAIGVNLPNADWLRKDYGSKSITIDNLISTYDESSKQSGTLQEFSYSAEIVERAKKYYNQGFKIEVDLHEVLGHGSGQK